MRGLVGVGMIMVIFLAGGCSRKSHMNETGGSASTGESRTSTAKSDWSSAWNGLKDAGEWTWEKTEDGAVWVWKGTKRVAGETADITEDAALTTAVKTRLAEEKGIPSTKIDVDSDDGVVSLRGRVDSAEVAARAVRSALETRGVDSVKSYLTW